MPYKSAKQRRFFNANKKKLARRGVDVDEWNAADKVARDKKNLERLVRLVEFVRGDYVIAHAARKGWLNPRIPRNLPAGLAAGFAENSMSDINTLMDAARFPALRGARLRLARKIRASRGLFRS